MAVYVTTNIRISKEMHKRLKLKAVEDNKSVSQLIREAIQGYFFEQKELQKGDYRSDSFINIIGMARSGIKDGSVAHDRYLYGKQ